MNGGLGVDQHRNLINGHLKQPMSFQNFKSLVHHRSRINGDAVSHSPGRVVQSHFWSDGVHFLFRKSAERTTRSGQDDPTHFRFAARPQTLMNGIMLAVNRDNIHTSLFGGFLDEVSSYNKDFFVCQRHGLSGKNRFVGRNESRDSHNGAYQQVGFRMCCHCKHSVVSN